VKEIDVDYEVRERLKHEESTMVLRGALDELLERVDASANSLILTRILVAQVEEAWGITSGTVEKQRWGLNFEKSVLWIDLVRDELR
jgi:hypothetical protein